MGHQTALLCHKWPGFVLFTFSLHRCTLFICWPRFRPLHLIYGLDWFTYLWKYFALIRVNSIWLVLKVYNFVRFFICRESSWFPFEFLIHRWLFCLISTNEWTIICLVINSVFDTKTQNNHFTEGSWKFLTQKCFRLPDLWRIQLSPQRIFVLPLLTYLAPSGAV